MSKMVKTGIRSFKSPLWILLSIVLFITVYISGKTVAQFYYSVERVEEPASVMAFEANTEDEPKYEEEPMLTSELFVENWILEGKKVACNSKKLLTILVISAPDHFAHRQAIRSSWGGIGAAREDIAFAFLIGSSLDPNIHEQILSENSEFEDIIMYGVEDLYENLSLKTIHGLSWIERFCQENDFFLKIDDDMFLQIPRLISFIRGYQRSGSKDPVIFGKLAESWPPVHNPNSKYFIRPEAYRGSLYPPFVTGPSYLMNRAAVKRLLSKALTLPYIHLEDVFLTGVVAEESKIPRKNVQEFRNNGTPIPPQFIGCTLLRTFTIHKVKPEEMVDFLKASQNPKCGGNKKMSDKIVVKKIDPQKPTS